MADKDKDPYKTGKIIVGVCLGIIILLFLTVVFWNFAGYLASNGRTERSFGSQHTQSRYSGVERVTIVKGQWSQPKLFSPFKDDIFYIEEANVWLETEIDGRIVLQPPRNSPAWQSINMISTHACTCRWRISSRQYSPCSSATVVIARK